MMISCPKCGFEQPKDQYCANCGVNMEKYKPDPKPLWKRVAGNWMFQLSLLVLVVFTVILFDSITPSDRKQEVASRTVDPPRLRQKSFRPSKGNPMEDSSDEESDESYNIPQKKIVPMVERSNPSRPTQAKKRKKKKWGPFEQTLTIKIYYAPKTQIEEMFEQAKPLDSGAALISIKRFNRIISENSRYWKQRHKQTKPFSWDQSLDFFSGVTDSAGNIGFYFRATAGELDSLSRANIALQTWSELKPQVERVDGLAYELTLPRAGYLVITGFAPKDMNFTEKERELLDGSPVLQVLNSSQFADDFSDLVLVLQVK